MSRIGKKEINIPQGVTVLEDGQFLQISGELGNLSLKIRPEVKIQISDSMIKVLRNADDKISRSMHGLTRTLIDNAITGVSKGFQKDLEIVGVGYRAQVEEGVLRLKIGFSHEVEVKPQEGINFEVKKNIVSVGGIDKQLVGDVAAKIRSFKKPEPYKGKGIKYVGEKVLRKVGKAVKSTTSGT
jgi:large subunit ribosomal protein L6